MRKSRSTKTGLFVKQVRNRHRRLGHTNLQIETLERRVVLDGTAIISEFLASNDGTIDDVDGDDSDWIEIYNPTNESVSLRKWALSDDPNDLTKWRFPDVELNAGQHLLVFASGKDRDNPEAELHTNFKLAGSGEYLSLVQSDGQTIASEFSPQYPAQITDVSFGVPIGVREAVIVDSGDTIKVFVPTDAAVDQTEPDSVTGTWLDPAFDDSAWQDVATGIGYVPEPSVEVLADSVADFSGVQGQNNWSYGSWAKNIDANQIYEIGEFTEMNPVAFFRADTNKWDVSVGGVPSLEISAENAFPSGAGFITQWAVRRWTSETSGEITINGRLANDDASGDGVVGRIFVNGESIYEQTVNGSQDTFSLTANVKLGDAVDFVIDAGEANDETGDLVTFTSTISGQPFIDIPIDTVADSVEGFTSDGTQGENGWTYGYYDRSADPDLTYEVDDLTLFPADFWVRTRFDWPTGSANLTQIAKTTMQANGVDAGPIHWPIRRYTSDVDGPVTLNWSVAKSRSGGDGLVARIFVNGSEIDSLQVAGDDRTGLSSEIEISHVNVGDLIDIAIDPTGIDGDPAAPDGDDDSATISATITRNADPGLHINTNIGDQVKNIGSSVYARVPFTVEDPSIVDVFRLAVKYDDAFVAYLNGQPIDSGNAPDTVGFNSVAVSERDPISGTKYESNISREALSLITAGENILQFHVMNASAGDDDLLFDFQLSMGLRTIESDVQNYFDSPTPGETNGLGSTILGPLVINLMHEPNVPNQDEPIIVAAEITKTFSDIGGATLNYRAMYGDTITLNMVDDGTGDDAVAGDSIFTATIPANLANPGEMVRWFVTVNDAEGRSSRFPTFRDPENSEEYKGTIINDPTVQSNLPVFHRFMERPARADQEAGTKGSFFYDGEFYDNVQMDLHGQSSRGFPTKSHDIDFPNDHRFRLNDDLQRMDDFNMLTVYADQSAMRNTLAWEQIKAIGSPHLLAFTVRVQLNGEFQALYDFVEDADSRMLARNDLNPDGSLYKMYNTFGSASGNEKKNRKDEGFEDLDYLVTGVAGRLEDAEGNRNDDVDFIMDNVDIPAMVNFAVGFALTGDTDCCHKNYYAYQDTGGTDLWNFMHWDEDLTQGRRWGGFNRAYFDDTIYFDTPIQIGTNNTLISKLYTRVPGFQEMVSRRLRSIFDQYVKPPGTPYEELTLENRVDELYELMKDDAALHNQVNRTDWGQSGFRDFKTASDLIKTDYSAKRREWLYTTQLQADDSGVTTILSGDPGSTTVNYFVPTDDSLSTTWTALDFDDSSWKSGPGGIGFEPADDDAFRAEIRTDVSADMANRTSIFMRIPFNMERTDDVEQMTLRMKYDDGYVVYLNGTEIARKNVRDVADDMVPPFDVQARSHSDRLAAEYDNVLVSDFVDQLRLGQNVLAVHGINATATGNDFLMVPELVNGALGSSTGTVPTPQIGNPKIDFGTVEFQPASNNQGEEYIELVNNNAVAVDISGWKISGDVDVTFKGGTVIPAGTTMYATPSVNAFKARTEGPSGGQRLFIYGNYDGNLPNGGGTINLVAADGQLVSTSSYTGTTSPVGEFLKVSEINFNPLQPSAAELAIDITLDNEDFEFIELLNTSGDQTLSLDGVQFTNGVTFDFTGSAVASLAPGERVLVVKDQTAFGVRYGAEALARVAGVFDLGTGLANGTDTLTLVDSTNSTIADFSFDSQRSRGWSTRTDGDGSSLEVIDFGGDYNEPSTWQASSRIHGTPGAAVEINNVGVVVNEVSANPAAPAVDSIELHNPTANAIVLNNYFLSDSANSTDTLANFAIPSTTINANGFAVFTEADFNPADGNGFALNSDGDDVYLTVGDVNGPTHFVDSVSFTASDAGATFGRMTTGLNWFAPLSEPTLNATNSGPKVGPIIVSEFQYNPGLASEAAAALYPGLDNDDLEFVELHNPSGTAVDLSDWRVRGGIDYDFAAGATLGAGQTLVVISFNPDSPINATRTAAFRAQYGIGENVALLGGYGNQLGNGGDRIALQRPGTPAEDDPTNIPRIVVDEVIYEDAGQWPIEADGSGQSLHRASSNGFGLDAGNWLAAMATPGSTSFVGGDLDGNGQIDEQDIGVVCTAIQNANLALDFDGSGRVDTADLRFFVIGVLGSTIGDSNLDGKFDSSDLTLTFQAGEYSDNVPGNSTWSEGDWNCDGDFGSRDLVAAFIVGDYVAGATSIDSNQIAAALEENLNPVDNDREVRDEGARIAIPGNANRPVDFDPADVDAVFELDRTIDREMRRADDIDGVDDLHQPFIA